MTTNSLAQTGSTVNQIITLAQKPGTKRVWLYTPNGLEGFRVDVVNGTRVKFDVTRGEWLQVYNTFFGLTEEWDVSLNFHGYTADPVMSETETECRQAEWEAQHPADDYGLEGRA
jgi:hypothetical protein